MTTLTEQNLPNPPTSKRISVTLPADILEKLEFLTKAQSITQNEAIRRAIATEAFFFEERQEGSKVILQKPSKELHTVIFR